MDSLAVTTIVGYLFVAIIGHYPIWRIVSRAGFPGVLSLLVWVPLLNIVMLWAFALRRWPALGDRQG